MTATKDQHTRDVPLITNDRTGHLTVLQGVMIGLRTNIEQPANRRAYNLIAEAIENIAEAERWTPGP